MQRIMGLVGEHKVPPLRGNLSGNLGEFGSKVPKQGEKLLLSSSGYRSEGVNRARSGGIDQGKPVFGTFKGERASYKTLPSASSEALGPTSHQEATSHQEVETKIFALKSSELLGKKWYFQPQNPSLRTQSKRIMGLSQCDGRFYIGFHIVYGLRPPTRR